MADTILMIDTSLLIDYFRKRDKPKTRLVQRSEQYEQLAISSVTEFEVYSGATPAQLTLLSAFNFFKTPCSLAHHLHHGHNHFL